jgi:large subunit ribosomal protein L19
MFKLNTQKTIKDIENNFIKTDLPVLKIGDNVKIGVKIIEGTKERVQFYEGTIIARKIVQLTLLLLSESNARIGIERVFLIHSQNWILLLFYAHQK